MIVNQDKLLAPEAVFWKYEQRLAVSEWRIMTAEDQLSPVTEICVVGTEALARHIVNVHNMAVGIGGE
jgi:hypothetical protein